MDVQILKKDFNELAMKKYLKKISLLIVCIAIFFESLGQGLTQDASGKSSIIYPGANIGLNIQQSTIDFNYARFSKEINPDATGRGIWIYGLNLKGKNNESIGSLFSDGNFTPSTSGKFVFGYTFKEGYRSKVERKYNTESLQSLLKIEREKTKRIDTKTQDFRKELLKDFSDKIDTLIRENIDPNDPIKTSLDPTISIFSEVIKKHLMNEVESVLKENLTEDIDKSIEKKFIGRSYKKELIIFCKQKIIPKISEFSEIENKLEKDRDRTTGQIDEYRRTHKLNRVTVFGSIGVNTTGFKYFEKLDTLNLRKSFKDTTYIGPEIKIGINYQLGGKWLFGLTLGRVRGSSFDFLDKVEYTSRKTTSFSSQQLISEKNITAYTPDKVTYQYIGQTNLEFDIVHFSKIEKKGILALNPYFRGSWSDNIKIIPSVSKVGLAGYFFKTDGIFLGGVYLELNDLNDNISTFNSAPLTKSYERLSFGIVGKLAVASIFKDPSSF